MEELVLTVKLKSERTVEFIHAAIVAVADAVQNHGQSYGITDEDDQAIIESIEVSYGDIALEHRYI